MKILHVIPSLSTSLGGPSQVALNLVKGLRDLGVDAEIATTDYDAPHRLDVSLQQRIEYQFEGGKVPVWFLPYNPPALKEFIFSQALTGWCWKHLRRYDLIDNHYLFSYAPTCAATIARWQGIPYTVRTMGQLTPWALAQSQRKKQIYSHLVERRNLNRAAAIHCTTEAEAVDVLRFGITTPTVTLPLGVNPLSPDPEARQKLHRQYNIPEAVPVVLFLSRLHYKKRPDLLLQSLGQLREHNYPFHLLLAGSGEADYIDQLRQLAASLGLADCVTFTGLVVDQAKNLLLQGSDLFVLPSFSENFGIAVAEALSAGLPVIVTPGVQIAAEIAAARAGLVVEGEVPLLRNAIAQVLDSAPLRQQFRANGQHLAQSRYAWNAIACDLIPIYQTILEVRSKQAKLVTLT